MEKRRRWSSLPLFLGSHCQTESLHRNQEKAISSQDIRLTTEILGPKIGGRSAAPCEARTRSCHCCSWEPGCWSPTSPGSPSGSCHPPRCWDSWVRVTLFQDLPVPTPFLSGGTCSASFNNLQISPSSLTPGWFLQESYAYRKASLSIKLSKGNFGFYESQTPLKQGNDCLLRRRIRKT